MEVDLIRLLVPLAVLVVAIPALALAIMVGLTGR